MRRLQFWVGSGLLLSSAMAADNEPPSIELLLYLAEWGTDVDGQLVDPLDVPESRENSAEPPAPRLRLPTSSKPEDPR